MSFVSIAFLIFYCAAIALRLFAGRSKPTALYLNGLLALSLCFYAWHVPSYLFLILANILAHYFAARWIAALPPEEKLRRRALLAGALLISLGLLGYFKYAGFLLELIHAVKAMAGVDTAGYSSLDIVLPLGISFYTFQSMSYTIDVYRGKLVPQARLDRFALYVAFFPQLVAGPIVRARQFLYQLSRRRRLNLRVFSEGAYLIVRGLFLKMVVADNLGAVVDGHWLDASKPDASGPLALAMVVFFSCQLFCDFAGYTDIARGLAYQLGFRLPINFKAPFIATSFREFWRRWHISLSEWMRDYVYISLGGSRRGNAWGYFNLFLVFLVSGLWHGAGLPFVIWGAIHGVAIVFERLLGIPWLLQGAFLGGARAAVLRFASVAGWFFVVQASWIFSLAFFRASTGAEGLSVLANAISGLFSLPSTGLAYPPSEGLITLGWWLTLPVWALHARAWLGEMLGEASGKTLGKVSALAGGLRWQRYERSLYAGVMLYAILTLYTTNPGFIYFQF